MYDKMELGEIYNDPWLRNDLIECITRHCALTIVDLYDY